MAEFRLFLPDDAGGLMSELDEGGVLTFVISVQEGSLIRGTELFNLMMRAFGDRIRAVLGVWRPGLEDSPSVNLDKVNERTAVGLPLIEAVRETWTFTRAARWGFTKVALIDVVGSPGNYTKLDVLMRKVEGSQ